MSDANEVPQAPYPPMVTSRFPSAQLLRSSLSANPHYAAQQQQQQQQQVRVAVSTGNISSAATSLADDLVNTEDSSTRAARGQPARVQFAQWDVLACINCVVDQESAVVTDTSTTSFGNETTTTARARSSPETPVRANTASSSRKQGPVLLDLRRLSFDPEKRTSNSLFETKSICRSRGNPSLGTSVSSTCLDVASEGSRLPPCATGLTTGALCIHSFSSSVEDVETWTPSIEYYSMPRTHRPATAVAWRPSTTTQARHVAIGLTGSGSTERTQQQGGGRRHMSAAASTGVSRSNPGDREYCCLLWDVEHQSSQGLPSQTSTLSRRTKTTPLYKLSHQAGVASLGWLLDGQTLAVGSQQRSLQLYDLRLSAASSSPPLTTYAHNFAVNGIEIDPSRAWHFATYSQAPGELVKLWDARRMDSPYTEIKVAGAPTKMVASQVSSDSLSSIPRSTTTTNSTGVFSVKWSSLDQGHLYILFGDAMFEYDTSLPGSRPVHINTIHNQKPILDFALYPYQDVDINEAYVAEEISKKKRVFAELFPKRMVVVQEGRDIFDVATTRIAPVAVSKRSGQVIHALGSTLWAGSVSQGPAAMESSEIYSDEDISATMQRRARCLHIKYSMDIPLNIKMLSGEISRLNYDAASLTARNHLLRLWKWIQRVEVLCTEVAEDEWDDGSVWPARGLMDAGAWGLLRTEGSKPETQTYSDSLCCITYDSEGRRAALTSCGWAGSINLDNVMVECEDSGEFERSAALAVWHGDIGAAVDALQRGAETIHRQLADSEQRYNLCLNSTYAETLELVSLSIAGYSGGDTDSSSSRIWRKACANLLQRNDLSEAATKFSGAAYLRHVLKFLLTIGIDDTHKEVLSDKTLSLCDRVAFACRFLSWADLTAFLEKCISDCKKAGDIEGLTITGIEKLGIEILQSYVDSCGDVQTAALVTSRVVFPSDWGAERKISAEWLHAYRSLLNCWQMWQSRAMFDVDRAELLRKFKMRQQQEGSGGKSAGSYQSRRQPVGRRQRSMIDPDVQATVPAQLDARCNYCSSPLGLRRQDSSHQWLSKMKSVLSCCPQCRKPLPRCAICMLSLGALNPYMELTKERVRAVARNGPVQQTKDDLSSLANLPFAEWFTWCMRCKHGGHAHHMVGWFSTHEICPVSGCDCKCQFDGIHRLKRLTMNSGQQQTTDANLEDEEGC